MKPAVFLLQYSHNSHELILPAGVAANAVLPVPVVFRRIKAGLEFQFFVVAVGVDVAENFKTETFGYGGGRREPGVFNVHGIWGGSIVLLGRVVDVDDLGGFSVLGHAADQDSIYLDRKGLPRPPIEFSGY